MGVSVRQATMDDVPACVALVEQARVTLETYEPRFWRRAENTAQLTGAWFGHLAAQSDTVFLVADDAKETVGFLIGRPQMSPPVYDPGGATALIDDFCVRSPDRWAEAGAALLAEARDRLRAQGFAQIVVVCPAKDTEKMALMKAGELSIASTWWTATP